MANRFKACRTLRGYTQDEVASMLGITRAAYSHYENGRRDIPTDLLIELADKFECTTDELLGSRYYYEYIATKE